MKQHFVRIPDDLYTQIEALASAEDRSVTVMVKRLLESAIVELDA